MFFISVTLTPSVGAYQTAVGLGYILTHTDLYTNTHVQWYDFTEWWFPMQTMR